MRYSPQGVALFILIFTFRDQNALKDFRDQSKVLQRQKNVEKMVKGKLGEYHIIGVFTYLFIFIF